MRSRDTSQTSTRGKNGRASREREHVLSRGIAYRELQRSPVLRARLDVDANDRFAEIAECVKAGVAKLQAELVFTLGAECAVALVTGGILRPARVFSNLDIRFHF